MGDLALQLAYWDEIGPTKVFSHPAQIEKLRQWVTPAGRILDYGCGYGRTLGHLARNGCTNLLGLDPAPSMIAAARQNFPGIPFDVMTDCPRVQLAGESIDLVLLFTVLTCVPTDAGQSSILAEISRVLRPDGILYISDMLLQADSRNRERYEAGARKYGQYGVFDLDDGATVRHHDREWIAKLTYAFTPLSSDEIEILTMNGNPATAFQWFGRKK